MGTAACTGARLRACNWSSHRWTRLAPGLGRRRLRGFSGGRLGSCVRFAVGPGARAQGGALRCGSDRGARGGGLCIWFRIIVLVVGILVRVGVSGVGVGGGDSKGGDRGFGRRPGAGGLDVEGAVELVRDELRELRDFCYGCLLFRGRGFLPAVAPYELAT
jgi:hypothetical protein